MGNKNNELVSETVAKVESRVRTGPGRRPRVPLALHRLYRDPYFDNAAVLKSALYNGSRLNNGITSNSIG